jgi:predicted ATPase
MTVPLTFLFTDLENSTPLWENNPVEMRKASARHDALLREVIQQHHGRVVKTTGDGFHAAFEAPSDGIAAALVGQRAIRAEAWPEATGLLKVRMGLHTVRIYQLCHPDLAVVFPALKSLANFKHNLHRHLSTFIGREKELAEVKRLLGETQLLTLLGPGGTGKTRLMLQAAEEVIEDYPDGVWLVELAPLTNPDLIPDRVAAALNVQEQPGRDIFETLVEYLRRKELLLLLDNVEHIVQESAEFTEHLLEHCPKLTMLVTGREALFIAGETTIQIPPLGLPKEKQTLKEIASSEGVQLFLERARAVRPDFTITAQNAATIAEVVRRLDGIPLALELAAARLRMLTIEQIKEHLNDRFRLLTGGRRTALPRQQTLQALIDWSWQLLDEKERTLLRRLSVFSGGWDLEAAQTVTGFDPLDSLDVFYLLEQLINKSLITVAYPTGSEARYGMLESIRQFAQDKLLEAGEGETLRDRHADYFVRFAQESEYHLIRETMLARVNRILLEMDNLRTVLTWTFEDRPSLALRISSALLYHWAHWIHPTEARNWLETSINRTRSLLETEPGEALIEDLVKAYIGLGIIFSLFGENLNAVNAIDEGIALARENGDLEQMTHGVAWRTNILIVNQYEISPEWVQEVDRALEISEQNRFVISEGWLNLVKFFLYVNQGEFAIAQPYFQRVIQIARKFNNPRTNANVLQVQARMAAFQGDTETAKDYFLKAIDDFRAINDQRNVLHSNSDLAHLFRRTGNIQEALPLYRETILRWQEESSLPAVAHQLECFAYMAIANGNHEHAARLLGRANATRVERLQHRPVRDRRTGASDGTAGRGDGDF